MPNTVVSFEEYRKKLRPTDEEIFLEAFEKLSDIEISELIDELCNIFEVAGPANDEGLNSVFFFTPDGVEVWESDQDEEDIE